VFTLSSPAQGKAVTAEVRRTDSNQIQHLQRLDYPSAVCPPID